MSKADDRKEETLNQYKMQGALRAFDCYFNSKRVRSYYIIYTLLFTIITLLTFSCILSSGRSLIWDGDGWSQHYKALVYYARYLRGILKGILYSHSLTIPSWDHYIGEGNDIINTFHYYVIGDPIALFSFLVPTKYMHYYYSATCILRMYLAGISFSMLAMGTGRQNRYGILAGAITYSFSLWALLNAARHIYFLNPMIYFPLVILGIEKVIRNDSPNIFIVSATISAVSNFYFFYIIVLLALTYTVIRLIMLYHDNISQLFKVFFRIAVDAIIAVFISGVMLVPVLAMFLQDSRISVQQQFHLFYPLEYYSIFSSCLTSSSYSYWACIGLTAPALIAVILLLIDKNGDSFLKTQLLICFVIFAFPILGRILNGMSYMTNRWSWAFNLLCSYILAEEWNRLLAIKERECRALTIVITIYYLVCLLADKSRTIQTFAAIPLLYISLLLLKQDRDAIPSIHKQVLVIAIVAVCSVNLGFWLYSPGAGNYVKATKENAKISDEMKYDEVRLLKRLAGDDYTRYTGRDLTTNANVLKSISSTQYYWSISNPFLNKFRTSLEMREPSYFNYIGYDDRTTPIELSSVEYYVTKKDNDNGIPFGYSLASSENALEPLQNKYIEQLSSTSPTAKPRDEQLSFIRSSLNAHYSIYKNDYALPLGYTYDYYISSDEYGHLDPVQRQESQLRAVYLDEYHGDIKTYSQTIPDYAIPYTLSCNGYDIIQTEHGFLTTADNTTATLSIKSPSNAETYLRFKDFDFKPTLKYDLYCGDDSIDPYGIYNPTTWSILSKDDQIRSVKEKVFFNYQVSVNLPIRSSAGVTKVLSYSSPDSSLSSGRNDFILNFGYQESPLSQIQIKFPKAGEYTFGQMSVYSVPMDTYTQNVSSLIETKLENVQMDIDCVSGSIDASRDKILVLSIPYSKGWRAFIDGKQVDVHLANERHLGIEVPKGTHEIKFVYSTPFMTHGLIASFLGIVFYCVLCAYRRKHYQDSSHLGLASCTRDDTRSGQRQPRMSTDSNKRLERPLTKPQHFGNTNH